VFSWQASHGTRRSSHAISPRNAAAGGPASSIENDSVVGLRDRALIGVMVFTLAYDRRYDRVTLDEVVKINIRG
jgi:hypothetical protein